MEANKKWFFKRMTCASSCPYNPGIRTSSFNILAESPPIALYFSLDLRLRSITPLSISRGDDWLDIRYKHGTETS